MSKSFYNCSVKICPICSHSTFIGDFTCTQKIEEIKVYRLSEYEWIAARNIEEARKFYIDLTGEEPDEDFVHKLNEMELKTTAYKDELGRIVTFKEDIETYIKNNIKIPCIFATNEP